MNTRDGEKTPREQAFCLYYFETRNPSLSSILAGYPEKGAANNANQILRRPRVKAYLKKLWDAAESPIVMSVRERMEVLSEIGRAKIGYCLDKDGQVDLEAIRGMPAVKEVSIIDWRNSKVPGMEYRTVKVRLLNPVESIHELNLMEKVYRINESLVNQDNRVVNIYVTGEDVKEKLGRVADRTRKIIDVKVEEAAGEPHDEEAA